jgi:hypothetical protein
MLEKLEAVFYGMQDLDMKPTPHNVRIMGDAYQTLREIYTELEGMTNVPDNGTAADPGRRDAD